MTKNNATKPTIRSFLESLYAQNPSATTAQCRSALAKAGLTCGKSTLATYRAQIGFKPERSTPPNAKSAAPQRLSAGSEPELHFRRLVARIGTDRAAQLLEQATQREID